MRRRIRAAAACLCADPERNTRAGSAKPVPSHPAGDLRPTTDEQLRCDFCRFSAGLRDRGWVVDEVEATGYRVQFMEEPYGGELLPPERVRFDPAKGTLAEQLVRQRTSLGLSQKESAGRIGVDASTLAKWERGGREPAGTVQRVCGPAHAGRGDACRHLVSSARDRESRDLRQLLRHWGEFNVDFADTKPDLAAFRGQFVDR